MSETTFITNEQVFDGVSEQRIENASVLVEGNLIKMVLSEKINAEGAALIDCGEATTGLTAMDSIPGK